MKERLYPRRNFNILEKLRLISIGATLLIITGCGITVDANDKNTQKLEECGGAAAFDQKSNIPKIEDIDTFTESVKDQIEVIYTRVSSVGNQIEIPVSDNKVRPALIKSSKSDLEIYFQSTNSSDINDKVIFDIDKGRALNIPIGTIACSSDDGIYPKSLVESLDQAIDFTEQLSE